MRKGKASTAHFSKALFSLIVFLAVAQPANAQPVARTTYTPTVLLWQPQIAYRSAALRVAGPDGSVRDMDFGTSQPAFSIAGLVDGMYTYEVTFGRAPSADLANALRSGARGEDGSASPAMRAEIDALRATHSGTFLVSRGQIVAPGLPEPPAPAKAASGSKPIPSLGALVVVPDSQSIQGSLCVGADCTGTEDFAFDTIRLKENNLRITFQDTSVGEGFANNVWTLKANDDASGGANKFSIDDVTGAKTPFTTIAGAPTDSLFISNTGRVGLRTNSPLLDLHTRTGNTPAIRLEQDNTSGFSPQTWDIGANEANFFIRDLTGGSRLSFRIRPGAPTSSIDINAQGHIGIGTSSPNLGGVARAVTISTPSPSSGTAEYAALELSGAQTGDSAFGVVRFYNKLSLMAQIAGARDGADNSSSLRFLTANAGAIGERVRITPAGFLGIGTMTPISRLHVQGDTTITGNLHVHGTCCGPDYVFDADYDLKSIEEQAHYMRTHRHLPAVGPARTTEDGQAIINVFEQSRGMLEEIEKAHLYIDSLHREIAALKVQAAGRDAELGAQLAAIKAKLGL